VAMPARAALMQDSTSGYSAGYAVQIRDDHFHTGKPFYRGANRLHRYCKLVNHMYHTVKMVACTLVMEQSSK
jgi:hypothetical protein